MKIFIPYNFCCLNEYINAERTNRYAAAKIKQKETQIAAFHLLKHKNTLSNLKKPLKLNFTWFVANKKKDLDNMSFSKKFILDGMVECGILENDGQKHVNSFSDIIFYTNTKDTGVEIEIEEQ